MIFISYSFKKGGAAKAAAQFYDIAKGITNTQKISTDLNLGGAKKYIHFFKRLISFALVYLYSKRSGVKCSANLFSLVDARKSLKKSDDIFNIHWINNDTISIYDLKKIPRYSILTLHDEWMYSGIEHYYDPYKDFEESPYIDNGAIYHKQHLSALHKYVWEIKEKSFKGREDIIVTCPSLWLADRAKKSIILKDCRIELIPNPIDTSIFVPMSDAEMYKERECLGLDRKYLLSFGAVGGVKNNLKGFSELYEALGILSRNRSLKKQVGIILFGNKGKRIRDIHGFPVCDFGVIDGQINMAKLYSISYVTIVPSKVEAFGQVAAESQSCGTPVIAFNTSGIKDVVDDGCTGYLAEPYSAKSLAEKLELILDNGKSDYIEMSKRSRDNVLRKFERNVIKEKYKLILKQQGLRGV